MTDENEFRPLSYYDQDDHVYKQFEGLEVNRAGMVRRIDTGEILHDIVNPESIEMAFPDMYVEEEWRPITNEYGFVYEISARGALRNPKTKVILRTRAAGEAGMQPWIDEAFPELKEEQ
jgi:hypothetical protein